MDPYFSLISLNRLWLHPQVPLQRKLKWLLAASCCKCAVISVLVAFISLLTWADRTLNDDGGSQGGDSDKLTQSPATERPMRRWGETRLEGFPHQPGRKWIYKIIFMENYIPASNRKSRHVLQIIKPLQSHVILLPRRLTDRRKTNFWQKTFWFKKNLEISQFEKSKKLWEKNL